MWIAILAALFATAGNNIGKVLQKRGIDDIPPEALEKSAIKAYISSPIWLLGVGGDVLGAVLTAVALALAPVSVIQPILAAGMAFLVLFSHFYLRERLYAVEWCGVALAVLGAIGMSSTLAKGSDQLLLPQGYYVLLAVVLCLLVCEFFTRRRIWVELSAGVQAGLCFGLSAAWMRAGMLLAQEHKNWLFGAAAVAGSFLLSSSGFFFQTRGLGLGRAVLVGTYTTVFALISAVLVGFVALNESLPPTNLGIAIRLGSMGLILVGVTLMAHKG